MAQQEEAILTAEEVKESNSTSFQEPAMRPTEEQAHKPTTTAYSTGRALLMLFSSIFVVEMLVMLLLVLLPPFSTWVEALLDSALLIVLLFPILYFLLFRRMILHIGELERMREALRRSQDETGRTQRLLLAFSQAAQAVQRARTPDEVYHTVGEEVVRLGFHAMVFSLTADRASLTISHVTFGPTLMQAAAKLTGISVQGYRMPLVPGGFFQRIIAEGQTIFADRTRTAEIIAEGLPGPLRPLVSRLAAVMGIEQGIVTRLTVGGEAHGVLVITGTDLTEADVPAVTAFASQTAIALENARAAEELRKGEERYRAFIAATAQVVWTTNAGGEVVVDSPVWREFTGQSEEALKGWGWIEAIHPDDRERAAQAWIKAVKAKSLYENEFRVRKYDGSYQLFLARAIPVLEADGSIREWVGTCTDITERKRAEEALREKEQRYRSLAESSPDAIFILDRDEWVIYVNQTSAQWLGRPVAELVGQRQADLFPTETARHQSESLQRVLATGKAERREEPTPFPGGVRWIETRLVPLLGPNDAVESVMGVSRDITETKRAEAELTKHRERLAELVEERTAELKRTNKALETEIAERKRAEEALRVSEERFALAVQGANDGIWDWDLVNQTLYWSPRMKELLGYADDELDVSYDTFESHLHPADRERINAAIEDHLKNGGLYDVEQRLRTKSGDYRWFHARGQTLWDEEGNPIRMIGSTADITERKQMEEKLRLLSSSVEQSSEGMAMVDLEGNLLFVNNAFATLHGYTSEELVGKHLSIFHTPEQMPSVEAANQQLQETGEFSGEIWHVRRDGTVFPTLMHNSVLQDEAGNAIGMIGTLRDITELKEAEEELKRTAAELARSNRELEQFAYVASHDLQEPLRMVSSYTQLLARRYQAQLDADANEFIAFAVDGANRMQRLINDLLTYSRVGTHGKGFESTDCTAVLEQALANLKAAIEQSDAVVTHDPLPTVMADNLQLVQLFQNLIGNAIKFHGEEPPRVHVSAEQKGNEWVFSVRDNGIGIDPRYTERLFILFQRLHTREEYPGTGIGLAICKKIAERHGGRIWVESQPGMGSTFYFTIPIGGNGL